MRTIGIDIGTTTISGVVLEKNGTQKARILEVKTIENGSFLTTANDWERIQDAENIVKKSRQMLDDFLERYPEVETIGLTGQMHGIVYIDKEGTCVSPLYTWQDARGSLCEGNHGSLAEEIQQTCKVQAASGYGMVTHIYNLRHDLIPDTAVLDPRLTISLPSSMTADTGMDALTHAMEAFLNLFASRSVQNASIEAVCENFHALPEVWRDGTHLAARQEMLHASYLAGFAFTNNFVGYVHAIAHAVGALYHIPHGRANAVLLPAVLREYGSCIAPKLAVLADALSLGGDTVSEKAERMIAAIEAMRDSFDIPSTLPHLSPNDYTEIARRALKEANPTYPVPQIWDSEKIFSVLRRVQS